MNKDLFEKSYFQLNLLGQLLTNETYAFDWLLMVRHVPTCDQSHC